MSKILDVLDYDIQKYLKIRKVLRIVELVGLLVVVLTAIFIRPCIWELIFSLLSVLIIPECFVAIQRWGTKSLIKDVLLFLNGELDKYLSMKEYCENIEKNANTVKIGFYQYICIKIEKKMEEVENLKRLVIF